MIMQFEKGRTSRENEWTITNPPFKGASINNVKFSIPLPTFIWDRSSKIFGMDIHPLQK